ncbi:MAG: hypothetical protein O7B35_08115, partial [Deltaproteobacteria bacterium]|nr:hypothetical protein [Deltaproteobacteria bacterium]
HPAAPVNPRKSRARPHSEMWVPKRKGRQTLRGRATLTTDSCVDIGRVHIMIKRLRIESFVERAGYP